MRPQQIGFSLIELMVSLSILGVLAGSMSIGFSEIFNASQEAKASQVFRTDLKRAQAEAQEQGGRVVVAVNTGGQQYTIGVDLSPFNTPAAADTVTLTRSLPTGVRLAVTGTIIFDSKGFLVDENGDLTTVNCTLMRDSGSFYYGTINQVGVL